MTVSCPSPAQFLVFWLPLPISKQYGSTQFLRYASASFYKHFWDETGWDELCWHKFSAEQYWEEAAMCCRIEGEHPGKVRV